jgi:aminoglycoside phosphotransferase (APT) family kinase protein
MSSPGGVDTTAVTAWFEANIPAATPPLTFHSVAGGRSNLTFIVRDRVGKRFVLRRPPLGHLLASAHDMRREHRIIGALANSPVPVPPALGFCEDTNVNEQPFYVMGFVDGLVLRTPDDVAELSIDQRRNASDSLVDTLVALHALEPDAVGLGDLGKREDYVQRQLKRWHRQFTDSKTREVPLIDELHERMRRSVPPQQGSAIVHGDYRLDNTMVSPDGHVLAVLDWEICTLGDPLADLAMLLVYSPEPNDSAPPLGPAATMAEGFASKQQLLGRYAAKSPRDLSDLNFYVAFGYWRLACILDGVYVRYATGAMSDDGYDFQSLEQTVPQLVALAQETMATN